MQSLMVPICPLDILSKQLSKRHIRSASVFAEGSRVETQRHGCPNGYNRPILGNRHVITRQLLRVFITDPHILQLKAFVAATKDIPAVRRPRSTVLARAARLALARARRPGTREALRYPR